MTEAEIEIPQLAECGLPAPPPEAEILVITRISPPEPPPEALLDAIALAVLGVVGRPGAGWLRASRLALRLGCPQREVELALAVLAQRGLVQRGVEWGERQVVVVWRYARGPRAMRG
jgi:hypothetical protein